MFSRQVSTPQLQLLAEHPLPLHVRSGHYDSSYLAMSDWPTNHYYPSSFHSFSTPHTSAAAVHQSPSVLGQSNRQSNNISFEANSQSATNERTLQEASELSVTEGRHSSVESKVGGVTKEGGDSAGSRKKQSNTTNQRRSAKLSSQCTNLTNKRRKRRILSSSDEHETTVPNLNRTHVPSPPRKKKVKKITKQQAPSNSQVKARNKIAAHNANTPKSNNVNSKAKTTEVITATLKSMAQVAYPGYSSGWSSPDSGHAEDVTAPTEGGRNKKDVDQNSAVSSVPSRISTGSWSSNETNKTQSGEEQQIHVQGKPRTSSHFELGLDNQAVSVPTLERDQAVSGPTLEHDQAVSGPTLELDQAVSVPTLERDQAVSVPTLECDGVSNDADPKHCTGAEDNKLQMISGSIEEVLSLAPESVDMDYEVEIQKSSSTGEQETAAALQSEVTVIPETQETCTGNDNSEVEVDNPGSPDIPLQNCPNKTDGASVVACSSGQKDPERELTSIPSIPQVSTVLHTEKPFSDKDSTLMLSVSSDTSEDRNLTRKQKRKRLLEKLKKRPYPKRELNMKCWHSDVGNLSSTSESRRIDSCSGRRARLSAKAFGVYHCMPKPLKRHATQGGKGKSSINANSKSDSEFIHSSSRKLLSLSRRKECTKRVVNDIPANDDERAFDTRDILLSTEENDSSKEQKESVTEKLTDSNDEHSDKSSSEHRTKEADGEGLSASASTVCAKTSGVSVDVDKQTALTVEEVVEVSSDSDSVDFVAPSQFKRRRPRPNISQRKRNNSKGHSDKFSPSSVQDHSLATSIANDKPSAVRCMDSSTSNATDTLSEPLMITNSEDKHEVSSHRCEEKVDTQSGTTHSLTPSSDGLEPGEGEGNKPTSRKTSDRTLNGSDSSESEADNGNTSDGEREGRSKRNAWRTPNSEDRVDKTTSENHQKSSSSSSSTSSDEESRAKVNPPGKVPSSGGEQKSGGGVRASSTTSHIGGRVPPHVSSSQVAESSESCSETDSEVEKEVSPSKLNTKSIGKEEQSKARVGSPKKLSPKKRSPLKDAHRPPRFLFSRFNAKKNFTQPALKIKNPNPVENLKGTCETGNSTGELL